MPEDVRGDRRELRHQADALEVAVLGIGDVLRVRVERRECAHRAEQHPHRVRVVPESLEKLRHVRVHVRVRAHVVLPPVELLGGRQLPLEQEIRRLEEARLLGELLDRVAAVAEDACVAVDVGDRAATRGRIQEGGVEREQAELREIGGTDRAVLDRERVLAAGPVVDDGQRPGRGGRFRYERSHETSINSFGNDVNSSTPWSRTTARSSIRIPPRPSR